MISQADNPKTVTFIGDRIANRPRGRITVRALKAALEKALVFLRGKDPDSDATVEWEVVKVMIGDSIRMTFMSNTSNGEISSRLHNLNILQRKKPPTKIPVLTDEDIDGTQELATMLNEEFSSLRITSPGEPTVKLNSILIEHVNEIAKSERGAYSEWGTIRGMLNQVTADETSRKFRIRHALTGSEIACNLGVDNPDLFTQVKAVLPASVEAYGKIRRNRADKPISIEVETLRVLPEKFVPFNEVPAVNITSGEDSADYVERLRSAS